MTLTINHAVNYHCCVSHLRRDETKGRGKKRRKRDEKEKERIMLPSIEGIFSISPSHSCSTQTLIVFSAHFLNLFNLCYVVSCSPKIEILKLKVEVNVKLKLFGTVLLLQRVNFGSWIV
jgi:hypothetical protein